MTRVSCLYYTGLLLLVVLGAAMCVAFLIGSVNRIVLIYVDCSNATAKSGGIVPNLMMCDPPKETWRGYAAGLCTEYLDIGLNDIRLSIPSASTTETVSWGNIDRAIRCAGSTSRHCNGAREGAVYWEDSSGSFDANANFNSGDVSFALTVFALGFSGFCLAIVGIFFWFLVRGFALCGTCGEAPRRFASMRTLDIAGLVFWSILVLLAVIATAMTPGLWGRLQSLDVWRAYYPAACTLIKLERAPSMAIPAVGIPTGALVVLGIALYMRHGHYCQPVQS